MKSKVNAHLSRKIKCNSFSMNFKKKIMLKRVSILFFILIFFSSIFFSNLNTRINEPHKKDPISYDKDPQLSNQGDDIFKLVFGTPYGPNALDPQNAWDQDSYNVINQVCEGLFSHNLSDPNLSIIPRLATAKGTWMINSTDTWYTVSLRSNVFFHDGTKFNASAVKFTFDRLSYFMNVSGTLPGEVGLSIISVVYEYYDFDLGKNYPIINNTVIIDEYTIRFELNKPYGPFEALLCFTGSYILSPTSTPQYDRINTTVGDLVGTGPFVYDHFIPGDEVKFHAFENYWAGKANITILKFSIIPSATGRNNALLSGEVDLIVDPLASMYDTFDADPDITLNDAGQTTLVRYLGMNNKRINVTWRKAISNAINYSYIINVLLEGNAIRLKSPLPENMIFANWSFNVALYNVTKAREIMQSMGFGVGFTTEAEWSTATFATFNYSYNIGNSFREDILTLLQVNLDKIGIEVTDAGTSWMEYFYKIVEIPPYTRDMLELYFLNWIPDYFDPSNYINDLFTNRSVEANGVQYNGYTEAIAAGRDPFDLWDNVQLLMDAALFETDQIARKAMYDRIQQLLVEEDMPWAFCCLPDNYDAYQSHILGFQSNSMGILSFYGVTQNSTIAPQIISIDGIQEWQYFKDAGKCTGQGTSSDPYVIEDLAIDGRNKLVSCIQIENSDVYFTIENCTLYNSIGAGIKLINASNGQIIGNNCSNNTFGIYLDNINNTNNFSANVINNNLQYGVILNNVNNTRIYNNNFTINNVNAYDNGTNNDWDNGSIGNYWDDYGGVDANDDGIGDTPYLIPGTAGSQDNFPIWDDGYDGTPIAINDASSNNWAWASTQTWCSGSGTWIDPYIIEGLSIDGGTTNHCIHIQNSTVYFIIRNCILFNGGMNSGIKLDYTNNGFILNNNVSNNDYYGIRLDNSNNNTISGNTANNDYNGIFTSLSYENTITNNTVSHVTWVGIYLELSDNSTISYNNVDDATRAIYFSSAYDNYIMNNNLINSDRGIMFAYSDRNDILNNNITDNSEYGVIHDANSDENLCYNNTFINNNIQANDNGTNNDWDNGSIGNYWDDYGGVDANDDGIGDTPYLIPGTAGSQDNFPIWDDGIDIIAAKIDNIFLNGVNKTTDKSISLYLNELLEIIITYRENLTSNFITSATVSITGPTITGNFTENIIAEHYIFILNTSDLIIGINNLEINAYKVNYQQVSTNITVTVSLPVSDLSINIVSPSEGQLFGATAPSYNVEISGTNLDTMWYTLDGGFTNITFITNGTIDQTEWDTRANGTVTIAFYANDILENVVSSSVLVRKDIIAPNITIISPLYNELFGALAPTYIVEITDSNGVDTMWYTLEGGLTSITFIANGTIDQTEWDLQGNGIVNINFYANDSLGNVITIVTSVRKDIIAPDIIIISPLYNELFGALAPTYIVEITDSNGVDTMWYTLDGGFTNITFTTNSSIDQIEWDAQANGTVTIAFYANDTLGHLAFNSIIVRKDILSGPTILINTPTNNSIFGYNPPNFNVEITNINGIDTMWYTLDGGFTNITFIANGTIDQTEWDAQGNGTITIRFYSNNTLGILSFMDITGGKDIEIPVITIHHPIANTTFLLSSPEFNLSITEGNLDFTWYSLSNDTYGTGNFTFSGLTGKIDQELWDSFISGSVEVIFYAIDIAGNIGFQNVSILKQSEYFILETIIIDDTGAGNYTWDQAKAQEWCSGSGTWNDPYIIEFLEIDGLNNGSNLIIRNSNAYFIIRDSSFYNSGGGVIDAGLKLEHVSNATLINLDCSNNNGHGIYLYNCYNITILESNMNHNKLAGIFLNTSSFIFILNNAETISYNHWGIYLFSSHNNTISGNVIGYNQVGLLLKQSNNNSITENTFMENDDAYVEEDSYGNTFQGNTVVQKPDNLFVIIITVIGLVSISGVSFIVVRKRIIIPKKGRKIKVYDKKKIKVEEKIHNRLLAVDRLIELKNVKEALKDLEEIKDLCKVYGLFEKSNECDEKINQCNSEYLEMINIVKRVVLNLATKFARLEIIDISEKIGISDINFIIEVLQEMFRNNEIKGEYFSKSKTIAFDRQSNIEQLEQFIKIYREWEMLNLDRDDSELLLEEIHSEEIKPKAIVSKLLPEKFKELNVFLSYFTLDADHFQILRVAKSLEEYPEIDKVMYWESDRAKEIADYAEFMDETLKKYDVFVLFCSTNSVKSASVKDEWQAAFEKRKKGLIKIIPVYEKLDDIPVILGHFLNVKYDQKQFENFIKNLYQEIMRSRGSKIS